MAKPEEWKGFWIGAVGTACVGFVLCVVLFFLMLRTVNTWQAATISCHEENRQLRELVVQYQAQIQKGQAPANLAEFLLKLLVK